MVGEKGSAIRAEGRNRGGLYPSSIMGEPDNPDASEKGGVLSTSALTVP